MPRDFKQVQVVTELSLAQLAEEIGFQVGNGRRDGITYAEVLEFIRQIDLHVGDSVFTEALQEMVQDL